MQLSLSKLFLFLLATAVMGSGIGYSKLYLFHVVLVAFLMVWFVLQITGRGCVFYKPKSTYLYFWYVFFAWYLLSVIWSIEPLYALRYLFYLTIGISLIYLINSYINSRERYQEVFETLRVVFLLAIIIALLEAFTSFRLPTSPYSEYAVYFGRKATDFLQLEPNVQALIKSAPTAFWGNPNNLSVAMVMIAPFFLMSKKIKWRWIGLLSISVIVMMAGSRGTFIALIFGIVVYVYIKGLRYLIPAMFLGLLLSFSLIANIDKLKNSENSKVAELAWTGQVLYTYLFEQEESMNSIGARQKLIRNGLDALWEANGLGVGGGGSQAVQERLGGVAGRLSSMHNFWVEVLVDAGVLMFSIFMIWYGLLSFKLYRIYTVTKDAFFKYHAGSLFIIMMVFLLAAVSASSVIYFFPMWLMFAMSISAVSLYKIEKNSKLSYKKQGVNK